MSTEPIRDPHHVPLETDGAASASDDVLMGRIAEGDSVSFEVLFERYHDRAYRVANAICDDDAIAERAVLEGFLACWKLRPTHADRGSVADWLLSRVRERAVDHALEYESPGAMGCDAPQ